MSIGWSRPSCGVAALAAFTLLAGAAQPASAQGLFETIFGGVHTRPTPSLPPQVTPYAEPSVAPSPEYRPPAGDVVAGPAISFCVRACDGRFFPISRSANATPTELCQSFCPASQTMVFHGSKIDTAVGPKGIHYSGLEHAFLYRKQVVDNCTCNGKDPFGLAHVDVKQDRTLHAGDIVATPSGLVTVRNPKTAEFTPINPGSKLADVKIAPAPRTSQSAQLAR